MEPNEVRYKNHILISLIICFMGLSLLSRLFQEGMFFDGITYSSISRNMAIGIGSFWKPFYISNFYDQPPLMFGIQSFFFKIFGENYLIEKSYCFIIFVITVFFIIALWRLIFKEDNSFRNNYWIPLLLWFMMPTVYWACVVNLLDNTVAIFTLAATYLKFWSLVYKKKIYIFSIFSAILVFLAFLVKGPTALFPLSITLIFLLLLEEYHS